MNVLDFNQATNDKQAETWITLDKIQHALGWSTHELADRLSLTEKRFQFLRSRKIQPSLYSVAQLIEQIGLSVERIVTGSIDYEALRSHAKGDLFYVPEKYMLAAFSKRRTSIHLLEYIENYFGWEMKKNILNHFQVTEAIFKDPDSQINFLFLSDFCNYFTHCGYSPALLPIMGAYSVVTNRNSSLGDLMASFGSPRNLHEQVFVDLVGKSFDRNLDYRLTKLTADTCIVEANFTQELQDALKQKKLGNSHVCSIRAGSFSSLTGYLNLPFSTVVEESCIHRGDACCRYRISFKKAQHQYHFSQFTKPTFH